MTDAPRRVIVPLESSAAALGDHGRRLRRLAAAGDYRRVRRGVFAAADDLEAARSDELYDARIAAVIGTRRSPVVLSHASAARVHDLPIVAPWPSAVHITVPPSSARRSKNGVIVHRHELADHDLERAGDVRVTSIPRTLIDLARDTAFADAVAAMDAALDVRAPRVSRTRLEESLQQAERHGRKKIERVVTFADGRSMSPLESWSRVLIAELGFPKPELQTEFRMPNGRRRLVDFWWPQHRVAGEADGRLKYEGDTAPTAVWEEKQREFEFLDHRVRFTRWGWEDCRDSIRLAIRLQAAGLPRVGIPRTF